MLQVEGEWCEQMTFIKEARVSVPCETKSEIKSQL